MDLSGLVYPKPADVVPEPPATQTAHGHRQHDARGEEDFAGLRRFHEGDSPRQVAWKAYARTGDLLSKQFSGADTSSQWFDFDHIQAANVELRLSIITRWIMDADRTQRDYGLRLPGHEFNPAHGEAHRHRCLETLAFFDLDDTGAKLMSKRTGTDGSLLTSLPWTLGALTFSVLPHLQFLPLWVTVTFLGCSAWRMQVERKRWRLPPAWIRIVLALMCFIGVLASL